MFSLLSKANLENTDVSLFVIEFGPTVIIFILALQTQEKGKWESPGILFILLNYFFIYFFLQGQLFFFDVKYNLCSQNA